MKDESSLKEAIAQARDYLTRSLRSTTAGSETLLGKLYSALPENPINDADQPRSFSAVSTHCFKLMYQIHSAAQSESSMLGARDLQTVHSLVELLVFTAIRGNVPRDCLPPVSAQHSLASLQTEFRGDTYMLSQHLALMLPILGKPTFVTGCIKARHLPEIVSAVLFCRGSVNFGKDLCSSLLSSLSKEAVRLLQACNTLLMSCSAKAHKAKITEFMTDIFLQPNGLVAVTEFILQPGENGQVALKQFEMLATFVAAKPARLTQPEYMAHLWPQIMVGLSDKSEPGILRRRAMIFILRELIQKHKSAVDKLVDGAFVAPLKYIAEGITQKRLLSLLEDLSHLTQDGFLASHLLASCTTELAVLGFLTHQQGLFECRGLCERLVTRSICSAGTNTLVTLWSNFAAQERWPVISSSDNLPPPLAYTSAGNTRIEASDSSLVTYFCRILENVKTTDKLLFTFYSRLLESSRSPSDSAASTRLLLEMPTTFTKKFYEDAADYFRTLRINDQSDEPLFIILNLFKTLLESPTIGSELDSTLFERLLTNLKNVIASPNRRGEFGRGVSQLAQAVLQQLQLVKARLDADPVKSVNANAGKTHSNAVRLAQNKYREALKDIGDEVISNRAHGLYLLSELAKQARQSEIKDEIRGIINETLVVDLVVALLGDEEAFVHVNAIKTLTQLALSFEAVAGRLRVLQTDKARFTPAVLQRIQQALQQVDNIGDSKG